MIDIKDRKECSGCSSCVNCCPCGCIEMQIDSEGFLYPKVDQGKCINCNICEKVCPSFNVKKVSNFTNISYACQNLDYNTRIHSSSGGVFSSLAEYVINRDGVVFGAAFDETIRLVHSYADNLDDYKKFRGSKYLQSEIGDTYRSAKKFLDSGKLVMFTGTPCQIDGLKLFLQKEYENLLLVDVVCHGVPSPGIFEKYIYELEDMYDSKVNRISFRHKEYGWKRYCVSISFENDTQYLKNLRQDIFMRGFLNNLYLRPSCHSCKSNGLNRYADITLADYWGVSSKYPEIDDDKGTSLILVNSVKGKEYFDIIKANLKYIETDIDHAIEHNTCILKSVAPHKNRERFFSEVEQIGFTACVTKHTKVSRMSQLLRLPYRVLRKIKNIISR